MLFNDLNMFFFTNVVATKVNKYVCYTATIRVRSLKSLFLGQYFAWILIMTPQKPIVQFNDVIYHAWSNILIDYPS